MASFECHYKSAGNSTFIHVIIKDKKWTEKGKVLTALKELEKQKTIKIPDPKKTEFNIPFALPCRPSEDKQIHPDKTHWDGLALTKAYFAPLLKTFKTIGDRLSKDVSSLNSLALKIDAEDAVRGALNTLYSGVNIDAYDK